MSAMGLHPNAAILIWRPAGPYPPKRLWKHPAGGSARKTMNDMSDHKSHEAERAAQQPERRPDLPEAARRALAEAAERRRRREADATTSRPAEVNGPKGPEPIRFGDWEKNGIASDF
jgi:hypothetical protein